MSRSAVPVLVTVTGSSDVVPTGTAPKASGSELKPTDGVPAGVYQNAPLTDVVVETPAVWGVVSK
jgi:hypothetical protein